MFPRITVPTAHTTQPISSPTDTSFESHTTDMNSKMYSHTQYKISPSDIDICFEGIGNTILGEAFKQGIRANLSAIIDKCGWEGMKVMMLRYGANIGKLALGYHGDGSTWRAIQTALEEEGFKIVDMSLSGKRICLYLVSGEKLEKESHLEKGFIQSSPNSPSISSPMRNVGSVIDHFNSLGSCGAQNPNRPKTKLVATAVGTSFHRPYFTKPADTGPSYSPDLHSHVFQEPVSEQQTSPVEVKRFSLHDEQNPVLRDRSSAEPAPVDTTSNQSHYKQHHMNWKQELRLVRGLLRMHDTEGNGSFGEGDSADPLGARDARMLSKALQTGENLALRVELGVKGGKIGTSVIELPGFQKKSKAAKMPPDESRSTNALGTPLRTKLNPRAALVTEQTPSSSFSPFSPHYLHQRLPTLSSASKISMKFISPKACASVATSKVTVQSSRKTGHGNSSPGTVIRALNSESKPSPTQTRQVQVLASENSSTGKSQFRLLAQPPKRKPPIAATKKQTQQSTSQKCRELALSSDKTPTAPEARTKPGLSYSTKPKPKPPSDTKDRQGKTEGAANSFLISKKHASNPSTITTTTQRTLPKPKPLCEVGLSRMNALAEPIAASASPTPKSSRIPRPTWAVRQGQNSAAFHNRAVDEKGTISPSAVQAKGQIKGLRECQDGHDKFGSPDATKKIGSNPKSGPKGNSKVPRNGESSIGRCIPGKTRVLGGGVKQRGFTRQI